MVIVQMRYNNLSAQKASQMTVEEVANFVDTDLNQGGLTLTEAEIRKKKYGPNEFIVGDQEPLWKKFLEQFKNPLIMLLLGSAFVSICMAQFDDATSIALAVLIVSTVAFVQEYRSEKSLEELSKLLPDYCTCLRSYGTNPTGGCTAQETALQFSHLNDAQQRRPSIDYFDENNDKNTDELKFMTLRIPARELVVGDLVLLKPGDRVPADLRLFKIRDLRIDESGFTGEAHPVKKTAEEFHHVLPHHHHPSLSPTTPTIATYETHMETDPPDARMIEEGENNPVAYSHVHMKNIAFMGTLVRTGKGLGIVIGTGERTEFGEIFKLMKAEQVPKTPLQKSMDRLGKQLSFYSLLIIFVIMCIGYIRGRALMEMFTIGVSLAVAAIPEGLPIVVTVTLALGVIRMSKRRVIVKKLPTVETLGRVNVLCSDKTGTLTTNQMTVTDIYLAAHDEFLKINDSSAYPTSLGIVERQPKSNQKYELEYGQIIEKLSDPPFDQKLTDLQTLQCLINLTNLACMCCDRADAVTSSPTELALFHLSRKLDRNLPSGMIAQGNGGDDPGKICSPTTSPYKPGNYLRTREIPFSSERKYMQVVCKSKDLSTNLVVLKGAPEIIISKCDRIQQQYVIPASASNDAFNDYNHKFIELSAELKQYYLATARTMAQNGLRVLAVAFNFHGIMNSPTGIEGEDDDKDSGAGLNNNIFLGFTGIQDPVKPNVPQVISDLKRIGIKVKMVTGDAKETAMSVAQSIGLLHQPYMNNLIRDCNTQPSTWDESIFMSGNDIDRLSTEELSEQIDRVIVFYRTSPIHKIKIVKALQDDHMTHKGNVVAMTGDGINDALALKRSDIGIAVMTMQFKETLSADMNQHHSTLIDMSSYNKDDQTMDDNNRHINNTIPDDPVVINTNDACKEAADMLFLDGDLSALTICVDEGKTIYENIRNFLRFQLSTSISALSLIAISTIFFVGIPSKLLDNENNHGHISTNPVPVLPGSTLHPDYYSSTSVTTNQHRHNLSPLNAMQILWINIIMDGPPAQSLGVEPPDEEIINRPPRGINDPMITSALLFNVCLSAITIVIGTIWVFIREMRDGTITPRDTTMTFTCFVLFDMFNALSCRSQKRSIFSIGLFTNRVFVYSVMGSIIAQIFVVYTPFFQRIFQTEAINFKDWIFLITLASSVFWISELKKYIERNHMTQQVSFKNASSNSQGKSYGSGGIKRKHSPSTIVIAKQHEDTNQGITTAANTYVEWNNSNNTFEKYLSPFKAALKSTLNVPGHLLKKYKYLVLEEIDGRSPVSTPKKGINKVKYQLV